ncbi:unnamed protein product [Cylindrotheca closterium]|uniref:Uncharacterized protein n=1 Tax=Cylindrotheca closterium TaxID=2856 RepID=A0AAD2CV92_9STRA|nr:unnamed protein product [Cylindrotheca closterium]
MNATENTLLLSFGEYQEQMVQNYLEDKDNAITVCTEDESDISSPVEPIESTIGGDHGYTKNCADWSSEEDSSDDSSDDDSLLDTSDDSSDEDDL